MTSIQQIRANAGDIVAVDCTTFTHFAIISDQQGSDGLPMVIGASNRTGTVREETWTCVVRDQRYQVIPNPGQLSGAKVLQKARSYIGKWAYSLVFDNCQHFVNWASGLPKESKQVESAVIWGVVLGVTAYALASEGRGLKAALALGVGLFLGVQLAR